MASCPVLADLRCYCSRCKKAREPEDTRPEAGAVCRLAVETRGGKRYLFDVATPCRCGAKTAVLELIHGR